MIRQRFHSPFLLLSLLLALAGCGDGVVSPDHPGESLITLEGQMIPAPDANITGQVRLALVWYPQWLAANDAAAGQGAPRSVVTEDVIYQGSFPVNYRFHVYRPPPEEALAPLGGGLQGQGAFGILLAYHDLNGNARLDTIPESGAPVDQVIGASLLGDARSAFALIYVKTQQPAETGLKPGFNVIQAVNTEQGAVVPLTTPLPLSLTTGGPLFDALVCEAGWLTFLLMDVCGLDGGDVIQPSPLSVDGRVALEDRRAVVSLKVSSRNVPRQDAVVKIAGRAILYDTEQAAHVLTEQDTALLTAGGSFELEVSAEGITLKRTLRMPEAFEITAPTAGEALSASSPLMLRWTSSQGANEYYVGFEATSAGGSTLANEGARSHTFDPAGASGAGTVRVEARILPTGDVDAWVSVALVREHAVTFGP
ncbi:MAG: hypothetical protein JXB05_05380 [Myxococcaceae bacterium]|nr:hypothetical protein [Myxococcaceae bacterium]